MADFYALDIETTGLDPSRDEIIEIAWARFVHGRLADTFSSPVRPSFRPSDSILDLTGLAWEELAQAPALGSVLAQVVPVLTGQVVVAHNAPFDRAFLERAAQEEDHVRTIHWLDTLPLSRAVWPEEASHSLAAARRRLPLEGGRAHRALTDAIAAGRLLLEALKETRSFPEGARQAISATLPPPARHWLPPPTPPRRRPRAPSRPPVTDLDEAYNRLAELPLWETRHGQRSYAEEVSTTLAEGGVAFLEAGAGTGKTIGYLVPGLLRMAHHQERLVIATRTRALQEQLWNKDLPLTLTHLGLQVPTALLKGRENYLCLRRLEEAKSRLVEGDLLNTVFVWAERTQTGDLDELASLWAHPQGRRLLPSLRDTPHLCAWRACPFLGKCPSRRARERAKEAQVVVVNHALLAADALAEGAVLGEFDAAVVDEAHALPGVARDAFTAKITPATVPSALGELRRGGRGLLSAWAKEANTARAATLWEEIREAHRSTWKGITPSMPDEASQYGPKLVASAQAPGQRLCSKLKELSEELADIADRTEGETSQLARSLSLKADELSTLWAILLHPQAKDRVFWHVREGGLPSLRMSPVELGPLLDQGLWSRLGATVLTSATLGCGGDVSPLAMDLGFEPGTVKWMSWPSPFAFDRVRAYVPGFLPRPDQPAYPGKLASLVRRMALDGGRKTLVLFTARSMLKATLPFLEDVPTLVQGKDGERDQLVRRFRRSTPPVVLMGLDTFWEGVDLPGDQVEVVVIARLPFPVPTDPLVRAEAERMRTKGKDPFRLLFLPRAVLRLRQGVGRLVRSPDDRGLLIIADPRVFTESYGSEFTAALPVPVQTAHAPDELVAALHDVLETPDTPQRSA